MTNAIKTRPGEVVPCLLDIPARHRHRFVAQQGESKVCYLKCCQRTGGIDGTGDDHMP
jgi:hypothetical protein